MRVVYVGDLHGNIDELLGIVVRAPATW